MAQYLNGYKVVKRHSFAGKLTALFLIIMAALPVGAVFLPLFSATDPLQTLTGGALGENQPIIINAITVVRIFLDKLGVLALDSGSTYLGPLFVDALPGFSNIASWMLYVEIGVMVVLVIFSLIMVIYGLVWLFKAGHEYYATPMKLSIAAMIFNLALFGIGIFAMVAYGNIYAQTYASELEAAGKSVTIDILWPVVFAGAALLLSIIFIVIFVSAFKGKYFIDDVKKLTEPKENTKVMMPNIVVNVTSNGEKVTASTNGQSEPIVVNQAPSVNKRIGAETLPNNLTSIGGHAFSNNHSLTSAAIPSGVPSIGPGAFANCSKLKMVSIPVSVKEIGYNAFFNCVSLERINYSGTKAQWAQIKRGSNWLSKVNTNVVVCSDGKIIVNPLK